MESESGMGAFSTTNKGPKTTIDATLRTALESNNAYKASGNSEGKDPIDDNIDIDNNKNAISKCYSIICQDTNEVDEEIQQAYEKYHSIKLPSMTTVKAPSMWKNNQIKVIIDGIKDKWVTRDHSNKETRREEIAKALHTHGFSELAITKLTRTRNAFKMQQNNHEFDYHRVFKHKPIRDSASEVKICIDNAKSVSRHSGSIDKANVLMLYDPEVQSHQIDGQTDGLPMIRVRIHGQWYTAKLDTCAKYSIAAPHIAKLGKASKKRIEATHVEGISGGKLDIVGNKTFLLETINGDAIEVDALIVHECPEDLLLGMNFFVEKRVRIDFKVAELIYDGVYGVSRIPFTWQFNGSTNIRIRKAMLQTVQKVNGETQSHIELEVNEIDGSQVLIIPDNFDNGDLMIAPTLATVYHSKVTIPVINTCHRQVTLPNKRALGSWIPIDENMQILELTGALSTESMQVWIDTLNESTKVPVMGEENIQVNHLNMDHQQLLVKLLRSYPKLVGAKDNCPPLTRTGVEHHINTGDHPPILQKRLRHATTENAIIKQHVEKMLAEGVIEEGNGPWGFPVVLVKKKDGEVRFCIDYRALNAITIKDVYPLPRIDETIDSVGGAQWFTTLDLKSGYWQLGVNDRDKDKTAFITRQGLFRFKRMPFGLCNAPSTFQRMMDCTLRGILWICCLVYLDDVIVYTKGSFERHILDLAITLERLDIAGLTLKLKKCKFAARKLEFLGHELTSEGVKPLQRIVEAVRNFPQPKNVDDVRRFVHLAGYYRKFIPKFGTKLACLTKMLRKNAAWQWSEEEQCAFENIKEELTSFPLLIYPNFSLQFVLVTDASTIGLGAALMQDHGRGLQPVAYASKVNNCAQSKYSITKLECLAIVWAVKLFRPYLYGRRFQVVTDHAALRWLLESTDLTGMLHRWALILQEYDFEIVYRPGKTNVVADALSRAPVGSADIEIQPSMKSWDRQALKTKMETDQAGPNNRILRLRMTIQLTTDVIRNAQTESKLCERLYNAGVHQGMAIKREDRILYIITREGKKIILPPSLWAIAFKECHGSIWAGHLRLPQTLGRLRQLYWFPNMEKITYAWLVMCQECGSRKSRPKKIIPPLRPLSIGFVGERWVLDIAGPLPTTQRGNRYVIAAIEWVSKYVVAAAIPTKTAITVGRFLVDEVIFKHGPFRTLFCDNAPEFIGKMVNELVNILQAKQHVPIPYRPNLVGLIERFNRTWKDIVSMYVNSSHDDWDDWLSCALYAYNSAIHTTTKFQPAQLMYGRRLPMPSMLLHVSQDRINDLHEYHLRLLRTLRENENIARQHIAKAQIQQAKQYNLHTRHNFNFKVDTLVWVHIPPRGKGTTKLKHQWRGPGKLLEDVGYDNWRILLLDAQLIVVAHVSQLVPFHHHQYLTIMQEVIKDWNLESTSRNLWDEHVSMQWLCEPDQSVEAQDWLQFDHNECTVDENDQFSYQTRHRLPNGIQYQELGRKYKRLSKSGKYEKWYLLECKQNNTSVWKRWVTRTEYDNLWTSNSNALWLTDETALDENGYQLPTNEHTAINNEQQESKSCEDAVVSGV